MKHIIILLVCFTAIFSDEKILAKIKDRVITQNDFIKRAEYTIRPTFCKSDNYIHKKIILNSLIAEKLMAIEVDSLLTQDNFSNNFLYGIKEQKMREVLLNEEVYKEIILDPLLVESQLPHSTKTYNLNFLSLYNDTLVTQIGQLLNSGVSFDQICYDYLKLEKIPEIQINYFDENDSAIHDAIFNRSLEKNEVIGPVYSKDRSALILRVTGWKNTPFLTEKERLNQIEGIEKKLYNIEYNKGYDRYVAEVMKGLKVTFFDKPFFQFAGKTYHETHSNKEQPDNNKINLEDSLLTLNNKIYTIGDINKMISKHPLTFRKENISKEEYALYFKYAIVDLIRDEKLNDVAYKNKYDNHPEVLKEFEMFRDASLSNLHLQAFLREKNITKEEFNENYLKVIDSNLNAYIDSLKNKYSEKIVININLLDKIELTHIDLYAYKKGVPYPFIVPAFPILTNKHALDFGKKNNF